MDDITILAKKFDDTTILAEEIYDITILAEKIDDITILAKKIDDITIFATPWRGLKKSRFPLARTPLGASSIKSSTQANHCSIWKKNFLQLTPSKN